MIDFLSNRYFIEHVWATSNLIGIILAVVVLGILLYDEGKRRALTSYVLEENNEVLRITSYSVIIVQAFLVCVSSIYFMIAMIAYNTPNPTAPMSTSSLVTVYSLIFSSFLIDGVSITVLTARYLIDRSHIRSRNEKFWSDGMPDRRESKER